MPRTGYNTSEISETTDTDTDALPWRITVHFADWPTEQLPKVSADGAVVLDAFRNSLKESSFTRYATNKPIFSLGYEDSTTLWIAVQQHNLSLFKPVNDKLLNPPGLQTKGIPLRLYLPHMPEKSEPTEAEEQEHANPSLTGALRVVQAPITPFITGSSSSSSSRRTPQTLGTALNSVLPTLFPSRRSPLLALPVLHGAVVPLSASLDELSRAASYADGWLHVAIKMMG